MSRKSVIIEKCALGKRGDLRRKYAQPQQFPLVSLFTRLDHFWLRSHHVRRSLHRALELGK